MFSGYVDDINNSISINDVYAGFNDRPVDIGVPQGNIETAPTNQVPSTQGQSNNTLVQSTGVLGKPAHWWLMFALVFVGFIFLARKYGGGDSYSNIRMSVYNGIFLTFFLVLILNFMKVFAAKFPNNPVSTLVLAA